MFEVVINYVEIIRLFKLYFDLRIKSRDYSSCKLELVDLLCYCSQFDGQGWSEYAEDAMIMFIHCNCTGSRFGIVAPVVCLLDY